MRPNLLWCGVVVALACWASTAQANFHFNTFAGSDWHDMFKYLLLQKNPSGPTVPKYTAPFPVNNQGWLELTQSHLQTGHAMWYNRKQYIIDGFNTTFTFEVTNKPQGQPAGDGIAFVIQNQGLSSDIKPVGAPGLGIGYAGISNSLAVEFDMWEDPDYNDPNANHISIHSLRDSPNNGDERIPAMGGSQLGINPNLAFNMTDGPHHVRIEYAKTAPIPTLSVFISPDEHQANEELVLAIFVDIEKELTLSDGYAYLGLTSSTGDAIETHNILNFNMEGDPIVHEIYPWAGPLGGATEVSVRGANFKNSPGTTLCKFSGLEATKVDWKNSTLVHCYTPSHTKVEETKFQFTLDKTEWMHNNITFKYYVEPVLEDIAPRSGPSTGGTSVEAAGDKFRPDLLPMVRCKFGEMIVPAVVFNDSRRFECSPVPAAVIGMYGFQISQNDQQYSDIVKNFFVYYPPTIDYFLPVGCHENAGDMITVRGNFTITEDMACKFGTSKEDITTAKGKKKATMYDHADVLMCKCPRKTSGQTFLEISLNDQQFTDQQIPFQYEATVWIMLIAAIVSITALLSFLCCSYFWSQVWGMKDYRLLLSEEYLQMTGKSRWAAMKDLVKARDTEERQRLIKVLNMLKARRQNNQPKFSNTRWGLAAAKALQTKRATEKKTGWDLLLSGNLGAGGEGAQSSEDTNASSSSGAWDQIQDMTAQQQASNASATASGGKKGWSAILAASKTGNSGSGGSNASSWGKASTASSSMNQ